MHESLVCRDKVDNKGVGKDIMRHDTQKLGWMRHKVRNVCRTSENWHENWPE